MGEVYTPAEDTLLLLDSLKHIRGVRVLEVGCGSGLISVTLAERGNDVTAADIDPEAVRATLRLAEERGVEVRALRSDLFTEVSGKYDVIIFNPPYLPCPPEEDPAVCGGEGDGVIHAFLADAWRHLADGGKIYLLLSSFNDIESMMKRHPYAWKRVAEGKMSFHTLYVYELTPRVPRTG